MFIRNWRFSVCRIFRNCRRGFFFVFCWVFFIFFWFNCRIWGFFSSVLFFLSFNRCWFRFFYCYDIKIRIRWNVCCFMFFMFFVFFMFFCFFRFFVFMGVWIFIIGFVSIFFGTIIFSFNYFIIWTVIVLVSFIIYKFWFWYFWIVFIFIRWTIVGIEFIVIIVIKIWF